MAATKEGVTGLAKHAPHWIAVVLILGVTLFYNDKKDVNAAQYAAQRDLAVKDTLNYLVLSFEAAADRRIEVCHEVQSLAMQAIEANTAELKLHRESRENFVDDIRQLIEMNMPHPCDGTIPMQ